MYTRREIEKCLCNPRLLLQSCLHFADVHLRAVFFSISESRSLPLELASAVACGVHAVGSRWLQHGSELGSLPLDMIGHCVPEVDTAAAVRRGHGLPTLWQILRCSPSLINLSF